LQARSTRSRLSAKAPKFSQGEQTQWQTQP
jgi:hypothetical protein